jgi:hypothetical protein
MNHEGKTTHFSSALIRSIRVIRVPNVLSGLNAFTGK